MSFIQSAEKSFSEIDGRKNGRDGMLTFGVDYLDHAMLGIMKNDLILIGAGSGMGKTQTCCNIARANVAKGNRVHYIALEAEYLEIERRIKYQIFARRFFADPGRPAVTVSYQNWVIGDLIDSCAKYEAAAASEFMNSYPTLFTYYKTNKFDINDLIMRVVECAADTDLIILDHVHYMDFDDDNENRAVKEIAKTARTLALEQGKPIILVSHLRKRDKMSTELAPGLEEFHGSSDLYKIATKALTMGPGKMSADGMIETYFRIVKNRHEGSVTRYIGKSFYNSREGIYEKRYEIGDAHQNRNDGFKQLGRDVYPPWGEYFSGEFGSSPDIPQGISKPNAIPRRSAAFSNGKNPYQR